MGYGSNRQSGDRSSNLVFMGILIDDDDLVHLVVVMANFKMPMVGTLTGARSLIAKAEIEVETRKSSWTV